ncbi:Scr1 family TA system antitoxin-like transcriptional regulator [Streptomyces sp. QH1-20]|uniref:Scr1 family TA system antitoxin-like transcriptional regulator n=1 Tax=Streptomyces sp. QH1-20 TaxID=3240934 RepID=UPI0035188C55
MTQHQPGLSVRSGEASQPTFLAERPRSAAYVVVGAYLRHLRHCRGRRLWEAARVLDCAISKVSRMEGGSYMQEKDVLPLLRMYGLLDVEQVMAVRHLLQSVGVSHHLGTDVGLGWEDRLAACEQWAASERTYSAYRMPRLVQSAAYAEALRRISPVLGDESRLETPGTTGHSRRQVTVLLDELILERPLGGAAVMAEQCEHLQSVVEQGIAEVLVVPATVLVPCNYLSELEIKGRLLSVRRGPQAVLYSSGPEAESLGQVLDRAYAAAYPPEHSLGRIRLARQGFERTAGRTS